MIANPMPESARTPADCRKRQRIQIINYQQIKNMSKKRTTSPALDLSFP
jgi:hypothetical protein